jgi:hypothetical protein
MSDPGQIRIIQKTHLDVGYTDLAARVVELYLRDFLPKALEVARELREHGGRERFVWTLSSWLVERYLDEASPPDCEAMLEAIAAGDIAWLGLPFTFHNELTHPDLFRHAIEICRRLDRRFERHTITVKLTDVPGTTIGAVPLLVENGIECLFIGANGTNRRPDVPDVFRWRVASGEELIVVYQNSYGGFIELPHSDQAISIEFTSDNVGPLTRSGVVGTFLRLQDRFPGARLEAGTLDDAARLLVSVREKLPLIEAEIGDLWIHGVASDPWKVARYRELCRVREQALANGTTSADAADRAADLLMFVPEHTWGLDQKVHLADFECFDKRAFSQSRLLPAWRRYESSWTEQRRYTEEATDHLGSEVASEARRRLATLGELEPTGTYSDLDTDSYESERFTIQFDERGAIVALEDRQLGRRLASPGSPSGLIRYQVFDGEAYERYWNDYVNPEQRDEWFVRYDFGKPGLEHLGRIAQMWSPTVKRIETRSHALSEELLVSLEFPTEACQDYGCPRSFRTHVRLGHDGVIALTLSWKGKDAVRVPEAIWYSLSLPEITACRLDKMGSWVDPLSTVTYEKRNLYMHAIHQRLALINTELVLDVESLDAPLVSVGRPALLELPEKRPEVSGGVHFNLLNTTWGTNFPAWYDDDASFRFLIEADRTARSELGLSARGGRPRPR